VLTPLAQYFWFVRAWRLIDAMAWPGLRYLGQSLWMVAVLVVLAAVLDLMVGHMIPAAISGRGAGGRQTLVDRVVHRISGGDRSGSVEWLSRPVIAASRRRRGRVPSLLGALSSATLRIWRQSSHAGHSLWLHRGTAVVSHRHRRGPHHGVTP